jgi:hypothetical protein
MGAVRSVVTCAQARERGLVRYFTGLPCKHGHVAERRTATSVCLECDAGWKRARYERDSLYRGRKKMLALRWQGRRAVNAMRARLDAEPADPIAAAVLARLR